MNVASKNIQEHKPFKCNDTDRIYNFRYKQLLNIVYHIFDWQNLPPNLPSIEIERGLYMRGFAVIFKHPEYGIVTNPDGASIFGVNIYNKPDKFTYAQSKLGSGTGTLGVSGVVMYNTTTDQTGGTSCLGEVIDYYAKMLTDIDVSLSVLTINSRKAQSVLAKTTQANKALEEWHNKIEKGEYYIPFAASGLFENIEPIFTSGKTDFTSVQELVALRESIMDTFYSTFGIQTVAEKKERMVIEEIQSDKAYMAANIHDMLDNRKYALEHANRLFDLNMTVEVNDFVAK